MIITVRVKPGSSKGPLVESAPELNDGGTGEAEGIPNAAPDAAAPALTVYLQQRAVDGQANTALVAILAKHFGVAKSRVEIVRGHTARTKIVRIDDDGHPR